MYQAFSRKKFEYELLSLKNLGLIKSYGDATDKWVGISGKYIFEVVYELTLESNPFMRIVVYSTIQRDNSQKNKTRDKAEDSVKVLLSWRMKEKLYLKSIKKLYRVETFFDNFKECITNILEYVESKPSLKEFTLVN